MKITLIQTDLLWNDPAGNRARFEQKIAEAGSADLIVLPEMFSTGSAPNRVLLLNRSGAKPSVDETDRPKDRLCIGRERRR